jgi:hypothetical protein
MYWVRERRADSFLSQLAFTQKLQKLEVEAKGNQERIDHWSTEHDKLKLEKIEHVAIPPYIYDYR